MLLTESLLDEFVEKSDKLGGPGSPACDAYWADFGYQPTYVVDQSLDPFSEAYVSEQIKLYSELSGRELNQHEFEKTNFEISSYVDAANPYNHPYPSELALHTERLSKAFRLAGVRRNALLLDMGCGWGVSSELAAFLGLKVSAVDINAIFVELVNARARKSGRPIHAVQSDFDSYESPVAVDAILFYECLHHAVRPWILIKSLTKSLVPDGKLILAGEPINDFWWTHWGLRLDALSIYCIRKFGWFESGWSLPFITEVIEQAGLAVRVVLDADTDIGFTIIGQANKLAEQSGSEFIAGTESEGFVPENQYAVFSGQGFFTVDFPPGATKAQLVFQNFRYSPVNLECTSDGETLFAGSFETGSGSLVIEKQAPRMKVSCESDRWVPNEELGNGDMRSLSLHLASVAFY